MHPKIRHAPGMLGFELKVRPVIAPILLLDYKLTCFDNGVFERSLSLIGNFAVLIPNWKFVE
jgi:hypothetical protein